MPIVQYSLKIYIYNKHKLFIQYTLPGLDSDKKDIKTYTVNTWTGLSEFSKY